MLNQDNPKKMMCLQYLEAEEQKQLIFAPGFSKSPKNYAGKVRSEHKQKFAGM